MYRIKHTATELSYKIARERTRHNMQKPHMVSSPYAVEKPSLFASPKNCPTEVAQGHRAERGPFTRRYGPHADGTPCSTAQGVAFGMVHDSCGTLTGDAAAPSGITWEALISLHAEHDVVGSLYSQHKRKLWRKARHRCPQVI